MTYAEIVAAGFYVPEKVLDNNFFVNSKHNPYKVCTGADDQGNPIFSDNRVQLTHDKIRDNTGGILERRMVGESESLIDMAVAAMKHSEFDPRKLEGIIVATVSPTQQYPSQANYIQQCSALQMYPSRKIYGLHVQDGHMR